MRLITRLVKRLPIAEGPVWREASARRWIVGLLLLALWPLAGLMAPAAVGLPMGAYDQAIALPAAVAVLALVLAARKRQPAVYKRAVIGLWAGLAGVIGYDLLYWLSGAGLALDSPWPLWAGMADDAWGSLFRHWIPLGAFWGLAYCLLVGKARWGFGPLYGVALWGLLALLAWVSPQRQPFMPGADATGAIVTLLGLVVFGLVVGVMTERLLPPERSTGKIIFLRDYQTRVGRR